MCLLRSTTMIGLPLLAVSLVAAPPALSQGSVEHQLIISGELAVQEPNGGSSEQRTATITLEPAHYAEVTVDYLAVGGTATAGRCTTGADFELTAGTVRFPPGTTSQNIPYALCNDAEIEVDETFTIRLENPVYASVASGEHSITILDADTRRILIEDVAVTEGNAGTVNALVTLRADPPGPNVSVSFATADMSATGGQFCVDGVDYVTTSGTATIDPISGDRQIAISVCGDTEVEDLEEIAVDLTNASNGGIEIERGRVLITNDDHPPTVRMGQVETEETDKATNEVMVTLTLDRPMQEPVTVAYETLSVGAVGGATCGSNVDFVQVQGATVTFAPGELTQAAAVTVCGDDRYELHEKVPLRLVDPADQDIRTVSGSLTIRNDDLPELTALVGQPGTLNETSDPLTSGAEDGAQPSHLGLGMTVTALVQLSGPYHRDLEVEFWTIDGSATGGSTCSGGADFLVQPGVATIPAGSHVASFDVGSICPDFIVEDDEEFQIAISAPREKGGGSTSTMLSNRGVTTRNVGTVVAALPKSAPAARATVKIHDDDVPRVILAELSNYSTGEAGETLRFRIQLVPAAEQSTLVRWRTMASDTEPRALVRGRCGPTAPGSDVYVDYIAASGTVHFGPGDALESVSVTTCGNTDREKDSAQEYFSVELTGAEGAWIDPKARTATGTIINPQ